MGYADRIRRLERTGSMEAPSQGLRRSGAISPVPRPDSRLFIAPEALPTIIGLTGYRRRLQVMIIAHGWHCVYCGADCSRPGSITIDHYIPKCRGGTNHVNNLVPACHPCNNAKGDRLPLDFVVLRLPKK